MTKSAHFLPMRQTDSVEKLAPLYLREIVRLHGVPKTIVSDHDGRFTSRLWRCIQDGLGTRLDLSTAFHPQTDGQSERTIQLLEDLLRLCVLDFGGSWEDRSDPMTPIRDLLGPLGTLVPKIVNFCSSYYLRTYNQVVLKKDFLLEKFQQTFQVLQVLPFQYCFIDENSRIYNPDRSFRISFYHSWWYQNATVPRYFIHLSRKMNISRKDFQFHTLFFSLHSD